MGIEKIFEVIKDEEKKKSHLLKIHNKIIRNIFDYNIKDMKYIRNIETNLNLKHESYEMSKCIVFREDLSNYNDGSLKPMFAVEKLINKGIKEGYITKEFAEGFRKGWELKNSQYYLKLVDERIIEPYDKNAECFLKLGLRKGFFDKSDAKRIAKYYRKSVLEKVRKRLFGRIEQKYKQIKDFYKMRRSIRKAHEEKIDALLKYKIDR